MDFEHEDEPATQGELFPDSALEDGLPDQLSGYRGPTACQVVGITYRQLDYWARTGLVVPSIRSASGSGSQRLYSFKDVLVLKVVKRLLDAGVSLQNIRLAVDHLRARGIRDLAGITLLSDGTTVYECSSPERSWTCCRAARVSSASPSVVPCGRSPERSGSSLRSARTGLL